MEQIKHPDDERKLIDWIAHYRAFWTEHVERLERLLETWSPRARGQHSN
ncbi:MAG TPA: hypothetical protein VIM73_17130 [Polyangiaceae bacterium]